MKQIFNKDYALQDNLEALLMLQYIKRRDPAHFTRIRSNEPKTTSLNIISKFQSMVASFQIIIGANSKDKGIA